MKRTVKSENKYVFQLRTFLIAKGWLVRKLHGNLFQIGLPDLLLVRKKDGKIILVEVKRIISKQIYYPIDLFSLLQGPQIGTILMLSKIRAPIFIIAGCSKGWLFSEFPFNQKEALIILTIEELYEILNEK